MERTSGVEIVFEDECLVVINKPFGMISNDSESATGLQTVQEWHRSRLGLPKRLGANDSEFFNKSGMVHRLDKDTSGVMILAKTEVAYEALKNEFLERKTQKKYLAMVHGFMGQKTGLISQPIERHPKDKRKFGIGQDLSRMAITEWEVEEEYRVDKFTMGKEFSLLTLKPHTGRTHQLRVHMQHLHHPIVADPIYGGRKLVKEDIIWCPRLFLHAFWLTIKHPVRGLEMTFEAQLPIDLKEAMTKLKKEELQT